MIALLPLIASSRSSPVPWRIIKTKKQPEQLRETRGISYTTAFENLRKFLLPFVSNVSDFSIHSLKSGGANRKTLNNNDLHQVEPAVLDLIRGLSPQNALEDHQNGGDIASSVVCFDLP